MKTKETDEEKKRRRRKKALLTEIRQLLIMTLACATYSAALAAFILPYNIVTGGMVGLSNLIFYACGLPVAATYAVSNAVLYALALWLLGGKFITKTLFATGAITLFIWIAQRLLTDPATGELIKILGDEKFMSMLIGCTVMGLSIAYRSARRFWRSIWSSYRADCSYRRSDRSWSASASSPSAPARWASNALS